MGEDEGRHPEKSWSKTFSWARTKAQWDRDGQDVKTCRRRAGGYESEMYDSSGDEWKLEREKCAASTSEVSNSYTKDETDDQDVKTCSRAGVKVKCTTAVLTSGSL
ncbi:hypothetical protein BaRGS_00037616, partial [Batillaria attramentaria]